MTLTGNSTAEQGLAGQSFFLTATLKIRRKTRNSWCTVVALISEFHYALFATDLLFSQTIAQVRFDLVASISGIIGPNIGLKFGSAAWLASCVVQPESAAWNNSPEKNPPIR